MRARNAAIFQRSAERARYASPFVVHIDRRAKVREGIAKAPAGAVAQRRPSRGWAAALLFTFPGKRRNRNSFSSALSRKHRRRAASHCAARRLLGMIPLRSRTFLKRTDGPRRVCMFHSAVRVPLESALRIEMRSWRLSQPSSLEIALSLHRTYRWLRVANWILELTRSGRNGLKLSSSDWSNFNL